MPGIDDELLQAITDAMSTSYPPSLWEAPALAPTDADDPAPPVRSSRKRAAVAEAFD